MLPRRQAAAGTQKAEEKLRRAYETRNECQRAAQGEFMSAISGRVLDLLFHKLVMHACTGIMNINLAIPHPFIAPEIFLPQIHVAHSHCGPYAFAPF